MPDQNSIEKVKTPEKLTGFARIGPAFNYSMAGFKNALNEPAIRLELKGMILNLVCLIALMIYQSQKSYPDFKYNHFLIAFILTTFFWFFIFLVEIINTAIEVTIDYISEARHPLAKKAKDLASAAVFLALFIGLTANIFILIYLL